METNLYIPMGIWRKYFYLKKISNKEVDWQYDKHEHIMQDGNYTHILPSDNTGVEFLLVVDSKHKSITKTHWLIV